MVQFNRGLRRLQNQGRFQSETLLHRVHLQKERLGQKNFIRYETPDEIDQKENVDYNEKGC